MDIQHLYGEDLTLSITGDIALSSNTALGQEKVLRDLLTNPGDDINHLDRGAGVRQNIFMPVDLQRIQAVIMGQMLKESYVDQSSPITVTPALLADTTVIVQIIYTDISGITSVLSVPYI
jgi:hypothetical protein